MSISENENLASKNAARVETTKLVTSETTVHLTSETNKTHNSNETSETVDQVSFKKSRCWFSLVSIRICGCLGLTGTSIFISCRN